MKKIFPIVFVSIFVLSCHKSEIDNDNDSSAAEDVCRITSFESDIISQFHFLCDTLPQVNKIMAGCYTVSVSGISYPKTVTLDFGVTNCMGTDGVNRRGIITATFSGKYRDSLTTINLATNSYYMNDNKIDLSRTIVNKGKNSIGNIWFDETQNLNVLLTNQKTISFSSSTKREWKSGSLTSGNFADDIFSITGNGSGVGSRGNNFSMQISKTLQLSDVCRWISQGEIKITPANLASRYIDFGDGACDAKATADINGNIIEIILP